MKTIMYAIRNNQTGWFDFKQHAFIEDLHLGSVAPTKEMAISGYGWSDHMEGDIVAEIEIDNIDENHMINGKIKRRFSFSVYEGFEEI